VRCCHRINFGCGRNIPRNIKSGSERHNYFRESALLHFIRVRIADNDKRVYAPAHSLAIRYEGVELVVSTDKARAQPSFRSDIVVQGENMLLPVFLVPEELDFAVQYPKLGVNRSGFTKKEWSYEPRIADSVEVSAYAVDTATDVSLYPFRGRLNIWRATYTNSNSAEDILITVNPSSGAKFGTSLRRAGPQLALIVGLIVAAMFWIMAWYFLMSWLLGKDRKTKGLWRLSLTYIGWNLLLFLPGAVLYFVFSFGAQAIALLLLVILFGAASVLTFALRHLNKLGVSTAQGVRAFIIVTLVSNGAYLLFVLGYARLIDVI